MPTNRITISATTSAAVIASRNTPIARSRCAPKPTVAARLECRMASTASATGTPPCIEDESRKLAIVALGVLVERGMATIVIERDDRALDRGGGHLGGEREDQRVAPPMRHKCRH